jgi:hypothetical protein
MFPSVFPSRAREGVDRVQDKVGGAAAGQGPHGRESHPLVAAAGEVGLIPMFAGAPRLREVALLA